MIVQISDQIKFLGFFPEIQFHLPSFVDNLVNGFVKHVGSSIDGGQACKALWQFAQPIEGVKVRGLPCK